MVWLGSLTPFLPLDLKQKLVHSCQQANLIPWHCTRIFPPTAGCSESSLLLGMFMLLRMFMLYGP